MQETRINPSQVKGWGVDADPANNPAYPMKKRNNGEQKGYTWERPPQQPINIEVHHSNERPNITAVYGTSAPPSGLSGVLRRLAFRFSESNYGHWLPLMMADRVNMIEGVLDDLTRGHIPNIAEERGWKVEWKYNRKNFARRLLVGAFLTSAMIAYLRKRD